MQNKLIAAGAGLFGYGALLGWAITADYYDQKLKRNQAFLRDMMKKQSEELYAVREELDAASGIIEDVSGVETVEDSSVTIERMRQEAIEAGTYSEEDPVEAEEDVSDEVVEETRANLQRLIDKYAKDEDAIEVFTDIASRSKKADQAPPFVISREKYAWDEEEGDEFDKITLTYYPRERLLLDDEEDVIDDVNMIVGWKNLSQFGGESGDADVVFVRNRRLMTDYEVVRDTENRPPAHIRYGMSRDEFETNRAAGLIRFRPGDV